MERFRDKGDTIYSFQDEFLVQCPNCRSCAIVRLIDPENADWFAPRRFSCKACGSSKDWSKRREISKPWHDKPVDDYFHYPLWLQVSCCGETLWAYNQLHLDFIEVFVKAELRERKPDKQYGWSNRSLFSRLPKWMQSGKNREAILKAIAKMRELM
jgi:hypothetical protein